VPSGFPFTRSVRPDLFDRVCRGEAVRDAAAGVGVPYNTAWSWWRDAGAMRLGRNSKSATGLEPGDLDRPGGRGHRLGFDERIEIMRGLDTQPSYAEIGRQTGRDRAVIWREYTATATPTGTITPGWPMPGLLRRPSAPRSSRSTTRCCAPRSRRGWMTGGARG
jgi:IS30 family transposase